MFFWLSKIGWMLISPITVILILLSLGGFFALVRWRRTGFVFIATGFLIFAVSGLTPIGHIAVTHLENRFPQPRVLPDQVAGIVVLGGLIDPRVSAARRSVSVNGAIERLIAAGELAEAFPGVPIIYTGGSGALLATEDREADHVIGLAGRLGISESRLILERNSRNTFENAVFSKAIINPGAEKSSNAKPWVLVTSAAHMSRAVGVFRKQGWTVLAYPVDYATEGDRRGAFSPGMEAVGWMTRGLYEGVGLIAYYFTGKTDTIYPGPEHLE